MMTATATSPEERIDQIIHSGIELPPLPAVGVQLMSICRRAEDDIDIGELANLIKTDPSLTSQILRTANSAYFGAVREVSSIRHAVTLIGLTDTISMLNYHVLMKSMPRFSSLDGLSYDDYWAHSWACAMACKMLGRQHLLVRSLPGELYLAGLLHGIGKAVLAMQRPEDYARCLQLAREEEISLHQAEMDVLGFNHAALGGRLLASWNIPDSVRHGVSHYGDPASAEKPYLEIASLTQFGFVLANRSGIGSSGSDIEQGLSATWVVQDGTTPLAEAKTQHEIVHEVTTTLKRKAALVLGAGDSEDDEDEANQEGTQDGTAPASGASDRPRQSQLTRRRPKTFWERLTAALRLLFGK